MPHHCHWPGCKAEVPEKMWGCLKHWKRLPAVLQMKIMKAYRKGQEIDKKPSKEYLSITKEIREWILARA